MKQYSAVLGLCLTLLLAACTDRKPVDDTLGGARSSSATSSSRAVDRAATLRDDARKMSEQMRKHGLRCSLFLEMQKCATFFARRALPNPDFVAALLYAQSRDVLVLGSDVFLVHDGVVAINLDATDEEIIRFLCGENGCPKK